MYNKASESETEGFQQFQQFLLQQQQLQQQQAFQDQAQPQEQEQQQPQQQIPEYISSWLYPSAASTQLGSQTTTPGFAAPVFAQPSTNGAPTSGHSNTTGRPRPTKRKTTRASAQRFRHTAEYTQENGDDSSDAEYDDSGFDTEMKAKRLASAFSKIRISESRNVRFTTPSVSDTKHNMTLAVYQPQLSDSEAESTDENSDARRRLFRRLRSLRPDLPEDIITDICKKLMNPRELALLPYNVSQWLFKSLFPPGGLIDDDDDDDDVDDEARQQSAFDQDNEPVSSIIIEELPDDDDENTTGTMMYM
jgi:hypothetical protein